MPYDKRPWAGDVDSGTHAFCACGESANKPYCDGSHSREGTGKSPTVCDVADSKKYAICMCGTTTNPPYCDGSHRVL